MLYIPNEGIGAEILPVGPDNAVMGGPRLVKIAFIFQRLEGAASETGLDIENASHAAKVGCYTDSHFAISDKCLTPAPTVIPAKAGIQWFT